ncbi:OmcA/MtrC family decaheme c-type cytochrome [Vibrio diabolicus]|uniref:OmcA/MtrC family decaheme c-type cytochrome n=1 Tax=Vibrio diabolicus TaxID=50719 RepID=UPI00215F2D2B|nr:OmcA/MtrC family decaheme c-type cytochrome [Vibrio diabolicus]MCS0323839.1 OmcA/MtrC family decaheme c-type cytochrome [Vibrio diabolicus]
MNGLKSIATLIFFILLLTGCGPDSKNDQNTPPTALGDFEISVSKPSLVTQETGETKLVVDFTVKDGSGRSYELDETKDFRISLLKAMPSRVDTQNSSDPAFAFNGRHGNTYWKSFHHSSNTTNNRASMESVWDGTLIKTDEGYRYTFAIPDVLKVSDPYTADSSSNNGFIAWDADKLHRIVMAYGEQGNGFTYVFEWVPQASSDAAVSRNVIETGTCENCHMGEPLHHGPGYRSIDNNIAVCTACHNDSNPGAAPARRPLAAVVHQYHGNVFKLGSDRNNTDTYKQPVDENDVLVTDINGLVIEGNLFPQDARNCTTCHSTDVAKASDANNWFEHPSQVACETCHLYRDRGAHDNQVGTAWVRNGEPQNSCSGCHRPYDRDDNGDPIIGQDASRSAKTVHVMRLENLAKARDSLEINVESARFIDDQFEVELRVSQAGTGIGSINELTPFINEHGHLNLLLNWDNGQGPMVANNSLNVADDGALGDGCEAQGEGLFLCHKDFTDAAIKPIANSTLTVNIADMPLCANRRDGELAECVTFEGIDLIKSPFVIAANNASGSFDVSGINKQHKLPVGADISSCNDCHKELIIHKLGEHPHAATDFQQCKNCHNSERSAFYPGMAADLKYHVHSFHAFGSAHSGEAPFPGAVNNCEACHTNAQYNLPSQQNTRPSLASGKYFSPALVACGACHIESSLANADPDSVAGDATLNHMLNHGAVFGADTAAQAMGSEQCATCHAIGQSQGVDKVHKVYDYR